MLNNYDQLTAESVRRIVDEAIAAADALVGSGVAAEDPRTYRNTLAPLDSAVATVNDAFGTVGFMGQVHPDEAIRAAGSAAEEKIEKWLAGLAFRADLYEAVRNFSETSDAADLHGEYRRNLDFWMRDFRRAGHDLAPDERAEIEKLRDRVIELSIAFERNLSEWQDGIDVTPEQLQGLPQGFIDRLSPGETEGTLRVSVDYPEYDPFMNQARDRGLRRQLQFKFLNRAAESNLPLLNEAVGLRWEIARRLGYSSVAEYSMETKMATPRAVDEFYGSLVPGLTALGRAEVEPLARLLDADHPGESLEPWDWQYYDTLQRLRDYGVDDNEVAAYFPLEAVVEGMLDICTEMFGVDFSVVPDALVWHPDVVTYEMTDRVTGDHIASFYADFYPRAGKFSHAACWRLRAGMRLPDGAYRPPVAVIVCNFTKPTGTEPSLLRHDEAVTLFHEFGHVLHNTLTEAELPRFSGSQTERDFVEAPSQIMENWMWEPSVLRRFARHHETDEPIPEELIDKMVAARLQNIALRTLRQVFYGHYDLALHGGDGPGDADQAYVDSVGLTLFPPHPGTHFGASFGHMMSDGYVAGYYGYLWSQVYGDDMFSVFSEEGVLNPEVGARYRSAILARGGTVDGAELLRGFLGRDPSSQAFLERLGLEKEE